MAFGDDARPGTWPGTTRHDTTRHDTTRHHTTRHDTARHGTHDPTQTEPTAEQLAQVVEEANKVVQADAPVDVFRMARVDSEAAFGECMYDSSHHANNIPDEQTLVWVAGSSLSLSDDPEAQFAASTGCVGE